MMENVSLQLELETVKEKLLQQLRQFTPATFIKRPQEQSWSAAEVAEHLVIIGKNIIKVLQVEGAMPDREPDKKVAIIKESLLDRATRRDAPENVIPTGTRQNQQELMMELQEHMQLLAKILQEKDLNKLCTVYPHPRLGRLTRLEWIYFIIYHADRHRQQLSDIHAAVGNV